MTEKLPQKSEILIYQTEDGNTRIDVRLMDKTVWLTQASMAELFQTTTQNITQHLRNIYAENELHEQATCKEFLQVQNERKRKVKRTLKFYNLDAILAVGYRIRSHRGTQFRRWATELLREYLIKGFVMDDRRLKEGKSFGEDYFEELLERIRDIRASEKRFYKKITDIYSLSVDYDPNAEITQDFFATVQNKLHWAIHGHTAAELIAKRTNAKKPGMGLTSWEGSKIRKKDTKIAKNYLNENELNELNRIVTMYLDYAEDQAKRFKPMKMSDWKEKLDSFLKFNKRDVLNNPGKVSAEVAEKLAADEYEKYRVFRLKKEAKQMDDFDKSVKWIEEGRKHNEEEK